MKAICNIKTLTAAALLAASLTPAANASDMPPGQQMCRFGGTSAAAGLAGATPPAEAGLIAGLVAGSIGGPVAGVVVGGGVSLLSGAGLGAFAFSLPCPIDEPAPRYTASVDVDAPPAVVGLGVLGNGLLGAAIAGPAAGAVYSVATAAALTKFEPVDPAPGSVGEAPDSEFYQTAATVMNDMEKAGEQDPEDPAWLALKREAARIADMVKGGEQ